MGLQIIGNSTLAMQLFVVVCLLASTLSCGTKDEKEEGEPLPAPTSSPSVPSTNTASTTTTPAVTTAPVPTPDQATVWIAPSSPKVIAGYNTSGVLVKLIDLTQYLSAGSITALSFYDHNTLLAFADPGAAGEKIMRIDLTGDSVLSISANWYQDATNLNATSIFSMPLWSSSKMLLSKATTSLEGLSYSLAPNINSAARIGNPYIASGVTGSATCNLTVVQFATILTYGGEKKLLATSSGVNSRLNVYSGLDSVTSCSSSLNFVGGTITAAHLPIGAAQLADGNVYVRYQFTSAPAIVRYTFDGSSLAGATTVFNDSSILNNTISDKGLAALDATNLLFGNWATDAVYKFDTATSSVGFFARDAYTTDVNAIAIRP